MAAAQRLDCVILNGTVVSPHGRFKANVGIRKGRVAVLTRSPLNGEEEIDASGKLLLPGLVDPHGHMAHAWTNGDAFRNETQRMILGGVTSYLDYSAGVKGPLDSIGGWISQIESHSYVDIGIQPIINGAETLSELERLFKGYGVSSFKFFFGGQERELYPHIFALNDGALLRGFEIVSALGPPARACVHAENWEIGWFLEKELRESGRTDGAVWTDAHPHICEEESIGRALLYAAQATCPLYIVHIALGKGPRLLERAKRRGVDVVGETCPHYLSMHRGHRLIGPAKYNPAVKLKKDQDEIWEAVAGRGLDCIGSDHIASTGQEEGFVDKDKDIWNAWAGLPGSGTILSTLLQGVRKKGLGFERLVEVSSYNPARTFGLYPRKGRIGPGADADIVILDPDKGFTFRNEDFLLKVSLLDGVRIKGKVDRVMLRGRTVAENGRVRPQEPTGRYLERRGTKGARV